MSADDRFRDVNWEEILYKLTARARHLFASARAKGYGNALARVCADPDDLADSVFLAALQYEKVKYKPGKGASLSTFLCKVLEDDFKDLLRKGRRLNRRLSTLDARAGRDPELPPEPGVVYDVNDGGHGAKVIDLRAAALHAADGDGELEDYVTAAFDCGAVTRADQASCLNVQPSNITNRRKKFLRLFDPDPTDNQKKLGGGE
jgi:DNA-directed RNA polymerase specialized sigma24 family protein